LRLQEFQTKAILAQAGIPVPLGEVADSPAAARTVAKKVGGLVAVKAQVPVGGRGKAGGIVLAEGPEHAHRATAELLGKRIKDLSVRQVLIEQGVSALREIYLGIVLDRERRLPVVMVSTEGGVDIEETAQLRPDCITRIAVHPHAGLLGYQARTLSKSSGLLPENRGAFEQIARRLYNVFWQSDASLLEINPLALTSSGHLVALDAKMIIDDNSLFRHPELAEMRDALPEEVAEREARAAGISYIPLEGTVGCLVNGAGLAMATMDVLQYFGASPANFLDVGGGATAERIGLALRLILRDKSVRSVLVNIFGGITRCDEVAIGLIAALREKPVQVPVIARLTGTHETVGQQVIQEAHEPILVARTLQEAAQKAVAAAHGAC